MAQDPDRPLNNGAVQYPKIDVGQNKYPPLPRRGGKGGKDDDPEMLRSTDQADNEEDDKILLRMKKRLDLCIQSEAENRRPALEDRKFYQGDQWPSDVSAQRIRDNRPCMTVNKIPTLVHQITNEQRQNRPGININPVGDRGDVEVAKMYRGLIRAIERDCVAENAYDRGFEDAVISSFGFWRVMPEYEAPDSLNQVLVVKMVRNPFTVYLDPMAQEADGSDSRYGFVTEMIPRDVFDEDFPDAQPMSWDIAGSGESNKNWITKDALRIAEYYEFKNEKRKLIQLSNGWVGFEDELDKSALDKYEIVNEREADSPTLHWYKATAIEILDRRKLPDRWMPIIRCVGDWLDIEGKPKYMSVVRFAKDPQRAYNYATTAEMEQIALAPKAPWLMAEGQDEGHEDEFQKSNVSSIPVLHYKQTDLEGEKAPPPARQQGPQPAQAWQTIKQGAQQDLMGTTGVRFDSTVQERMYDESGRALRELRQRGDLGSFHFVDNFAGALRHTGEILIDLIPKYYDTPRVLTILREDDSEERVKIDPNQARPMQETRDQQTQKMMRIFNPKLGRYGVTTTIGPSYATKRIEASESMMDFARAIGAQNAMLFADLIAKNQDWPGAEEMATRLARIIAQQHPGAVMPEMKDVPPQLQAALVAMQQQLQQTRQQNVALNRQILDQQADRDLRKSKQDQDYEVKLLAIAQKEQAAQMTHIGSQLQDLANAMTQLHTMLQKPADQSMPMQALGGGMPREGRAPDGNLYVPNPKRPGRYLRVV